MGHVAKQLCIGFAMTLLSIGASAGDDYLVVNEMATCSSFYAFMRDLSESESVAKGYSSAETRIFARIEAEMGRETAIHMTRASWNTWRLLAARLSPATWNALRGELSEQCREFE